MGAGDIYKSLEGTWYSLLDGLSDKGVPIYKLIDPIENAGIPTLSLFVGVTIIVLALAAYILMATGGGAAVNVYVTIDGEPAESAVVIAGDLEVETNADGYAELKLPAEEIEIEVGMTDCFSQTEVITPSGQTLEFDLSCRGTPPVAGCSTIADEYGTAMVVGEGNSRLVDCSVIALDGGSPVEIDWGVDGNTMFLDDSVCLQDDYDVRISCMKHERTLVVDELRDEILQKGEIVIYFRSTESGSSSSDCDMDGIPDSRDTDNDNDGILDVDDYDIDGDGLGNKDDADTCGVDTRVETYIPPVIETFDFGDEPGPILDEAEVLYSTYVTAISDMGQNLDGMKVSAIGEGDEEITPGYDGVVTQSSTVDGSVTLVIPDGQSYYVMIEDPANTYGTIKSGLITQTRQQQVRLIMQKGAKTMITVVGGQPIRYAHVKILGDIALNKETGWQGSANFVLDKGREYKIQVSHPDYIAVESSVTGGQDVTITLEALTDENSGFFALTAVNAQGIEEDFRGVKLELMNKDSVETRECITPANGRCDFGRVLADSYTIEATPPGAIESQNSNVVVVAGARTDERVLVDPALLEIRVLTKVDGNPAKDVKVKLIDMSYGRPEGLATETSGDNRRVVFETYRGKKLYLEAEYDEAGPVTTSVFELKSNVDMEIDVTEMQRGVSFVLPNEAGEIAAGKMYEGKLRIDLPYADEKKREKYESATVEIWLGEPGSKENPARTPVVLGPVDTYVFEKQQRPRVTVAASDSYTFDQDRVSGEPSTTSKYLKFTMVNYEPTIYEITVPMFARREASGVTKVRYRATWTTTDKRTVSSKNGDWDEATLTVLEGDDNGKWWPATGDFSSYNAFFSQSTAIEGEEIAEKPDIEFPISAINFFPPVETHSKKVKKTKKQITPSFTTGSFAYLHIRAIASKESDNYLIKLDSFPPVESGNKTMVPVAYKGLIKKADGKTRTIYAAELTGSLPTTFSPVEQSKKFYSLDVNDELYLVVALRAKKSSELAEVSLFNDLEHTLKYSVKKGSPLEETTIANVEARLHMFSVFCPTAPYLGDDCYEGETPADEMLPSYDIRSVAGREIDLLVELANTGTAGEQLVLRVEATGIDELEYNDLIELPANSQKEIQITGVGNAVEGGEITIYLSKQGEDEQLWKTIKHGAISYEISVLGINEDGEEMPGDMLSTVTKEIRVEVLKKSMQDRDGVPVKTGFMTDDHADAVKLSMGKATYWASLIQEFEGSYYTTIQSGMPLNLDWSHITVTAEHPRFGALSRSFEVQGTHIEPAFGDNSYVLSDSIGNLTVVLATVKNNWDELNQIKLEADVWQNDPDGDGTDEFGMSREVRIYDVNGIEFEPEKRSDNSRDIPPRGKAEAVVIVNPPGTECNVYTSVNRLTITTETKETKVEGTGAYQLVFSCDFQAGPTATQRRIARAMVFRDSTRPKDVTTASCSIDGTTVYLCDSEQMSTALLKAAEESYNSNDEKKLYHFAMADDTVTPVTLSEVKNRVAWPAVVSGIDSPVEDLLVMKRTVTCGLVSAKFTKLPGGKMELDIGIESNVAWCKTGAGRFISILNYDDKFRDKPPVDKIVDYVGLSSNGDASLFFEKVVEFIPLKPFLGYYTPDKIEGADEAAWVIDYREFNSNDFRAVTDPRYSWLMQTYPSTGYFNLDERTGTVQMGIIYDEDTNLDKQRECMVSNLVEYWTTGEDSSLRVGGNEQQAFDLEKCVVESGLDIPEVLGIEIDSLTPMAASIILEGSK